MIDNSDGFANPADFGSLATDFLNTTIDTLFDRAAEQWSERIAIREHRCHWTYRELQQHVDRLAALLTQVDAAGQDQPVALCLSDGAHVIAAMLATLKAGGFYVVIDPRYPVDRNAGILKNCEARWLITDEAYRPALDPYFPASRILMWHEQAASSHPMKTTAFDPSSRRAAIVYTSGSTGQPKGVVHSHAFILNWTQLYVSDLHLSPSDRISLLYSASVAGAIRDIYGALLTGATLLPFTASEHSFNELANYLVEGRITIYHSVATLFRGLMASLSVTTGFPDIRALVFGGERVLAHDLSLIRKRFTADTLVYTSIGSTEAGTFARLFLRADHDPGNATIPLGFTPAECHVTLVDGKGLPVADGESGEIVVESRYLADGYWNSPQETSQVFDSVPDDTSVRRYHTGDLGVRNADGMLSHAGRADRQFTIRGYRIEPAEIEAALLTISQVTNAIVQPEADGDDTQVIAYVEGTGISQASLRAQCARLLPQYMVPAEFYISVQFPRLPNNKVDLQQLLRAARPGLRRTTCELEASDVFTVPELWQSYLTDCDVNAKTDFFAAGGDSLMAMRLMNRVGELFGVNAPMTLLFRYPTLEAFEKELQTLVIAQESIESMNFNVDDQACSTNESMACGYAQTNIQLYEELYGLGYTAEQLNNVAAAYDLAISLFSALLRPEGKPFINHLVGTASILAQHGAPEVVVISGLLHAAYSYGEFGSLRSGVTSRKRRRVRVVIGKEAEATVCRYTRFQWNARVISSLKEQLPDLSPEERTVIFIRLANELEEGADVSLLYCAEETRLLKANYLGLCVELAKAMGMQQMAVELEDCHHRNLAKYSSGRPEIGQNHVYSMPKLMRLRLAIFHALRRAIRN